jgi:hypothetical protein
MGNKKIILSSSLPCGLEVLLFFWLNVFHIKAMEKLTIKPPNQHQAKLLFWEFWTVSEYAFYRT